MTDASSLYNAGWSYGKEQLGHNKPPDTSKGSFYYNPVTDTPGTEQDRIRYPYSYPCNIWPPSNQVNDDLLPDFQKNAKQMGLLLKDVAIEIAKHLDVYVQNQLLQLLHRQQPEQPEPLLPPHNIGTTPPPPPTKGSMPQCSIQSIYHHLKDTDKVKARLLYYYPLSLNQKIQSHSNNTDNKAMTTTTTTTTSDDINVLDEKEDSWIGWHNDSGFLTALAGDIYVNHMTGERISSMQEIDPYSGLYVMDRSTTTGNNVTPSDRVLKVCIPYDCCAIQIGECVQIMTGGTLCATPHCVRGCNSSTSNSKSNDIARISLPCFIDTHPSFPLVPPIGISRQQVLNADQFSHNKVPPLALRWNPTTTVSCNFHDSEGDDATKTMRPMSFGEFLQETFRMYYGWGSVVSPDSQEDI